MQKLQTNVRCQSDCSSTARSALPGSWDGHSRAQVSHPLFPENITWTESLWGSCPDPIAAWAAVTVAAQGVLTPVAPCLLLPTPALRKVSLEKPQPLPKTITGLQSLIEGKTNKSLKKDPRYQRMVHFRNKEEVRQQSFPSLSLSTLYSLRGQGKHK